MILVWQMRRDIEYYGLRALVQAAIDIKDGGKAADEAWKEYTDVFYPHVKSRRSMGDKAALACLVKEVQKGKLAVRPLQSLIKSKLHSKRIKNYGANDNVVPGVRQWKGGQDPGGQG